MTKVTRLLLAVALLCCGCSSERKPANGQRVITASPEHTPPVFLSAVIQSLASAERGLKVMRNVATRQSSMVDAMTANQNATIEVRRAKALVEPYTSSREKARRAAARGILNAYGLYEKSLGIQLAALDALDSATTPEALKGMSRRASDVRNAFQQGTDTLIVYVGFAVMSSMVAAPNDSLRPGAPALSQHTALDMSAAEQRALVTEVDSLMGKLPSNVDTASGPAAAAILMREMLVQWRAAR